ncbi:MAG: hypothetical protein ACI9OJ_005552 [Myxococcota bacterium]
MTNFTLVSITATGLGEYSVTLCPSDEVDEEAWTFPLQVTRSEQSQVPVVWGEAFAQAFPNFAGQLNHVFDAVLAFDAAVRCEISTER